MGLDSVGFGFGLIGFVSAQTVLLYLLVFVICQNLPCCTGLRPSGEYHGFENRKAVEFIVKFCTKY